MTFNIVISVAGKSQRFFDAGFLQPKYFLPMADGKSMIEHSIDSLNISGNLILIVQKEHCDKYAIDTFLKEKYPASTICYLEQYTQGAAESVYLATKHLIDVKKSNLDSMTRGWLIGNFEPSILKTDFY